MVGALAANLLYALAVLIATADLPVRRLGWIAAGMTGGALLLAVGGWRASETLLALGTPPTMGLFIAWAFLATRSGEGVQELLHRPAQ